jgi:hypothetical protein
MRLVISLRSANSLIDDENYAMHPLLFLLGFSRRFSLLWAVNSSDSTYFCFGLLLVCGYTDSLLWLYCKFVVLPFSYVGLLLYFEGFSESFGVFEVLRNYVILLMLLCCE